MALRLKISHKYRAAINNFHIVEVVVRSVLDGLHADTKSHFIVTDGQDFSQTFDWCGAVSYARFFPSKLKFEKSDAFAKMFSELDKTIEH